MKCEAWTNVGQRDEQVCERDTTERCVQCDRPICDQHREWWSIYSAYACLYPRHA